MSNQYLSFDVTKQSTPQQLITGRQGDSQLKFISVLLWDGEKNIPYDLTGKQVAFEALKPDNTHIVDYEGITILDAPHGLFRYSFNEQVFAVAGTMQQAFFKITHTDKDDQVIADSTLEINIHILENRVEFGINSTDYLSEYDDLIAQVKKKFDDYAATVQDSIDKANALHDQIVEYTKLINDKAVVLKSDLGTINDLKQPLGTTLIDKLNYEFTDRGVNVAWYGAKGDGVTDDTLALQSALNNHQQILLSPGRKYNFTAPLIVHENTYINGQNATLSYGGAVMNDHGMLELAGDNITIEHLIINGNIKAQIKQGNINQHTYDITESRGLDGIRSAKGLDISNILISKCRFQEIQKMGVVINTEHGKNLSVQFSKFEYTNRDGSWLVGNNVSFLFNDYLNTHDNAIVFDGQYGDADYEDIKIIGNHVLPSTNLLDTADTSGESFMDGIYIGQNVQRTINCVLISNNTIDSRYMGVFAKQVSDNLLISDNVVVVKNNSGNVSSTGISVEDSNNGIIADNKIHANAYAILGNKNSNNFTIRSNDVFSNYIDIFGFNASIIKDNISNGTNSAVNKIDGLTGSQVIDNNFKGDGPYFDSVDGNIYQSNFDDDGRLVNEKYLKGTTLPANNTNGLSFDALTFFNNFDLTQDLDDIGPNTGAGLDFVVLILHNKTASNKTVAAHTLKNFTTTIVAPNQNLTILVAKYDLYTCISQKL